ncbi:MAG: LamG domain-containing protein, partial [Phycisphaerales bacterium]
MGRGDSLVVMAMLAVSAWGLGVGGTSIAAEPGLIGHWKLDGNAGDSAGGNHGTVFGNPTWANDPQRGWCLDFDGQDDYIDVGEDPSLTFSDAITLACWIKVRAFDRNWSAIVTKGDDWVLARTRDDNRVAFLCLGLTGGGWPEVYSGDVNDGDWRHIAGVYDGAELSLYQDGLRVDAKSLHGDINRNWSRVLIGENGQTSNRFWNGLIDDVRLYNRALTAEEIGVLAEAEPVPPPPPPAAPQGLIAIGHDSRIDLRWTFDADPNLEGYNIYRAETANGPFIRLNKAIHKASV